MKNKKIYALLHIKKDMFKNNIYKLELNMNPKFLGTVENQFVGFDESKIYKYNSNYFYSCNLNALKDKANEIKNEWIKEIEEELKMVKEIYIPRKKRS